MTFPSYSTLKVLHVLLATDMAGSGWYVIDAKSSLIFYLLSIREQIRAPSTMSDPNSLAPPGYGYNPHTNHYVLKTGAVWKRLVKSGAVSDPELVASMAAAAASRRKPIAPKPPAPVASKAPARAKKKPAIVLARKVVAENKSELDDLESDAATDFITQKLAIRTKRECLESASEDVSEESSEEEQPPRTASRRPNRSVAELREKLSSLGLAQGRK